MGHSLSYLSILAAVAFTGFLSNADVLAQEAEESHNVRLLGHNDLQARSAYHPVIQRQMIDGTERWIAYVGHHGGQALNPLSGNMEKNGTSVVDVTDPERPVYLQHIEASYGTSGAQMVRVCSGAELPGGDPSKSYLLRANGGRSPEGGNVSHQVFDVTDPGAPALLAVVSEGLVDTHKSWWECDTGIAYIVSGVPGWRVDRMTQIFDLGDPSNPRFIRNFGLPGQQPGSDGEIPVELHGCISVVEANRVYCGQGTNSHGILAILDRNKLITDMLVDPENPTAKELEAAVISQLRLPDFMGAHTSFPILGMRPEEFSNDQEFKVRDVVVIVNESLRNECTEEARQMVYFVDITDEMHPWPISTYNVSDSSGDFCLRGGRFGAHGSNESFTPIFYRQLIFVSWFNAGMRVVDIRDPFNPKEIGYYIPAITENTDERCVTIADESRCKIAIQTNNLEVDDRGYIYLVDRANTGMHIVELTGDAREAADFSVGLASGN